MRFKPRLDYKRFAANVGDIQQNCTKRGLLAVAESIPQVASLYGRYGAQLQHVNVLRSRRNKISASMKSSFSQEAIEEASKYKMEIQAEEQTSRLLESQLQSLAEKIPNDIHPAVQLTEPSLMHTVGTPRDTSMDHLDICKRLNLLDLTSAAEVSGYGWYYLKGHLALLEQALISFALDIAGRRGWEMMSVPSVVRSGLVDACGYQPRDEIGQQIYNIAMPDEQQDRDRLSLAGTAEIPLAGLGLNHVFPSDELSKRYVGVGRSYRAEAGSRGVASRGLFRVHEFSKVELFAFTTPDQSDSMLEEIRLLQQEIVESLQLCVRLLDMPANDLGASAYRKYDMEAWMPGRQTWGEITSCSNCTDYQARRLHARYRSADGQLDFVHTLNGTAAAIPRLLIALLETGWDGEKVRLPKALEPWMRTAFIG